MVEGGRWKEKLVSHRRCETKVVLLHDEDEDERRKRKEDYVRTSIVHRIGLSHHDVQASVQRVSNLN